MSEGVTRLPTDGDAVTLSTGQTLEPPVSMDSSITAVVLPADRRAAAELLPDGLSPIRAGRATAAVWLLSATHRNVGGGALDDYHEFAVMVSATPGAPDGVPYVSPALRTETYVWSMPVTTEPARAFGEEIWGYPKVVADISIEEGPGRRRTTVTVDGDRLLTVAIRKPPTVSRSDTLTTYAVRDGQLLRVRADVTGKLGVWPYTTGLSYSLGEHPRAATLRDLDLGDRAFARFHSDARLRFRAGQPIDGG
ncbi:hypothetical protein GCM10008995_21500 [Halobellus salinus]|uniref:Acetoacetate decarboxylase n=1 Tax=Halobellus salinus TaxID=931585 RepID=A0A830ECP6_9EURY|nr:acetoacetate decarboxylase family protein [Halobellus salinus]GGJ11327.1 hypothetical protein GCM10008995_21500 [Halobellus salinus]SMP03717.1 Acetoacetate decarboxylase (ADC) [Halobellus salinus]